jgi:hypothetical protein
VKRGSISREDFTVLLSSSVSVDGYPLSALTEPERKTVRGIEKVVVTFHAAYIVISGEHSIHKERESELVEPLVFYLRPVKGLQIKLLDVPREPLIHCLGEGGKTEKEKKKVVHESS